MANGLFCHSLELRDVHQKYLFSQLTQSKQSCGNDIDPGEWIPTEILIARDFSLCTLTLVITITLGGLPQEPLVWRFTRNPNALHNCVAFRQTQGPELAQLSAVDIRSTY